jgi:DNA-binding LacI/PurR family transcriptional regulator
MKEIARAVGVSQSTVSRVLNASASRVPIAADTRRRILEAVRTMGYRPNPLARGLRGAGTALLGLIVREISDPFFASAIEVIAAEARSRRYSLVLGHARSSGEEALALAGVLETRHCEGLILLGDLRSEPGVWDGLVHGAVPAVALCGGQRAPGIPTVNTDNRMGVTMALDHLYELGHRLIGYVDAGWIGDVAERREAYDDFLARHGLELPAEYRQAAENDVGAGRAAFERLLALPGPPTAVLCATDQVALGVLAAAARQGVEVPEAMSVVGFDDIPMARSTLPALTTVRQPLEEMARWAMDEVLAIIRAERAARAEPRYVPPALLVRDSCAPPRRSP